MQELARRHAAATGNPLLDTETLQATSSGMQLKRKWNDDVVFHNQARNEPVVEKRFINDTVRSDFHRSFMRKYIK